MKAAFYAGASGLAAYQEALDTIGNNLANVNTNGYKSRTTTFQSLLSRDMYANTEKTALTGAGVRAQTAGIASGAAALADTGGTLDFALAGNGWFAVEQNGQTQYTRDGNFSLSIEGDRAYLVAQDGAYVLNRSGGRISLAQNAQSKEYDYTALRDSLGVFRFANADALTPAAQNRYLANRSAGNAVAVAGEDAAILPGALERSGVSLPDEMASLIAAQRAYQLSARVVQAADENEQTVNGLRR